MACVVGSPVAAGELSRERICRQHLAGMQFNKTHIQQQLPVLCVLHHHMCVQHAAALLPSLCWWLQGCCWQSRQAVVLAHVDAGVVRSMRRVWGSTCAQIV